VVTVDGQLTMSKSTDLQARTAGGDKSTAVYEAMALDAVKEIRRALKLGEATLRAGHVDTAGVQTYVPWLGMIAAAGTGRAATMARLPSRSVTRDV
jgi:hypothetical protein